MYSGDVSRNPAAIIAEDQSPCENCRILELAAAYPLATVVPVMSPMLYVGAVTAMPCVVTVIGTTKLNGSAVLDIMMLLYAWCKC
jgi:hypothetical protein